MHAKPVVMKKIIPHLAADVSFCLGHNCTASAFPDDRYLFCHNSGSIGTGRLPMYNSCLYT
jgi:hypothetical protein